MLRTFFYTQIKSNDFNILKNFCTPHTKDIFGANQEHIIAFEDPKNACKAALQFLNVIFNRESDHPYKIVLVNGEFTDYKPQESTIRVARALHQHVKPRNLYFSDDVLTQINSNDIVFEKRDQLYVKELQKDATTYALTRFENTELIVDPTDLFDFSQVDSYSSMDKVQPTQQPAKNPFESSNTTLELATPHTSYKADSSPVKPLAVPPSVVMKPVTRVSKEISTQSQLKSLFIISVLLILVSAGGFYLARSKPETKNVFTHSSKVPASETTSTLEETSRNNSTSTDMTGPAVTEAFVNIHSTPNGAEVWMNGKKITRKTPIDRMKVSSEEPLIIDVQKKGYEKVSKKIDLDPKETLTVLFQLDSAKSDKSKPVATKK